MIKEITQLELFNAKVQRANTVIDLFGFSGNEYQLEQGSYVVIDDDKQPIEWVVIDKNNEAIWFDNEEAFHQYCDKDFF